MAFFKCQKCKKIWQYPIKKCPECFQGLERIKTTETKVIGTAKVSIPSIFHSQVPYYVLVLEDENKNRWIKKVKKAYKIGDEFKTDKQFSKETVAVFRIKYDLLETIEKTINCLEINVKPNSKILILPTLEKASHPYFRDNTSPEFLESVLVFLFQSGIKPENIKIASQSFDDINVGVKAQKSGLLGVCQKYKVSPVNLGEGEFFKRGDLEISKEVQEIDLILNLPILKIGRAQAIENIFFLLKKEYFLAQKYLYSESEIFEKVKKEIPNILTIAEANQIRDEQGFTFYLNLAFASFSPDNLDMVFYKIIQKKPPQILSNKKPEEIKIFGDEF